MAKTKKPVKGKANIIGVIGLKPSHSTIGSFVSGESFTAELNTAAAITDVEEIDLTVNTVGGSVIHGNTILNAIQKITVPVYAHIDAIAASMGYFSLLACDKIFAAKNSLIMVHSVQGQVEGSPEDMIAEAEVLKKFRATIAVMLAERLGKTVEEVTAAYLGEDKWFTAEEALAEGLIDGIDNFDAQFELPQAALDHAPLKEVMAVWDPTAKAKEAVPPVNAGLLPTLNGDERYFYEDLIYGEKQKVNAANYVLKYTTNTSIIDLAKQTIADSSAKIIELVTLLYGSDTQATAQVDAIIESRTAKVTEEVTAAAVIDFNAKLKLKDNAIGKLTTEKTAALKLVDDKTAEIAALEEKLAKRPVDENEVSATGTENGKKGKFSWTKAKYGSK